MFIPPGKIAEQLNTKEQTGSKVRLKASHLLVDQEVASITFREQSNVYAVYYPERHSLLLAPANDEMFKSLHKAAQHMLKDRNLKGDKSIALHELLIDNQIDDHDRDLVYELQAGLGILNVQL